VGTVRARISEPVRATGFVRPKIRNSYFIYL
jgi:hypothetical protein